MPILQLDTVPEYAIIFPDAATDPSHISYADIINSELDTSRLDKLNRFRTVYANDNPSRTLNLNFAILHIAIATPKDPARVALKIIRQILQEFPELANAYDMTGTTLLMHAASNDKLLIIDELLQHHADPKLPSIAVNTQNNLCYPGENVTHMCLRRSSASEETIARLTQHYNPIDFDLLYTFIVGHAPRVYLVQEVLFDYQALLHFNVVDDAQKALQRQKTMTTNFLCLYTKHKSTAAKSAITNFFARDGDLKLSRRILSLLYVPFAVPGKSFEQTLYAQQLRHYAEFKRQTNVNAKATRKRQLVP
jgi:hypothetical protein